MATTDPTLSGTDRRAHGASRAWPAWHAELARFAEPSARTSAWQVANTVFPYAALLYLMIRSVQQGRPYAQTLALAVVASAFLVRLFILFHDCVHGALFRKKGANTFFGTLFGVLAFTPFEDWRASHLRHHLTYADLDARGFGDIWTLTRTEYEHLPKAKRWFYRAYRNPVVLVGLGALFNFLLRNRIAGGKATRKERMSVLLTNLLIVGVMLAMARLVGWKTYLLIQLPVVWTAGAAGIWLFYVQHQFEGVYWARSQEWDALRAAMEGSSFYRLPTVLRWFSGSIGYHHVHHLSPRVPNYRLQECFAAVPALQAKAPLSIRRSLATKRLKVWDEERKELVGFR
jgi:omega-6 fatty acid desaturase (delta-12 desaturase)